MNPGRTGRRSNRGSVLLLAVAPLVLLSAFSVGSTAAPADGANVTVYRATDADFETADAVEAAIANGTIRPATEAVVGDTLVAVIESDRLAATMAAHDGSATDRFFAALDGDAAFRIVQTNPTPQRSSKVASLGPENVTVRRDGSTTYALVETGKLTFRYRNDRVTRIYGGERFAVRFGYNLTATGGDPSGPVVELYPFESELGTAGYWYEPLAPEWVAFPVSVNIAPEESLAVRVTLDGGRTIAAPVDPDDVPGHERVWLDLRGVDPGTDYALELVHDGEVTDRYAGTVLEPRAEVTNVTLTEVTTRHVVTRSGERVTERIDDHAAVNATVTLSHGGKVQVLDGTCEQVGFAWVEPGGETRVSMKLWNGGEPLRGIDRSEYGVLVRTLRHNGASKARYRGTGSERRIGFDGTCRTPEPPSTPTPTPTATTEVPPTATTPPTTTAAASSRTATPTTARGRTGGARGDGTTGTPGQSGLTALASLGSLLALALFGIRRS